jgi:hypothetical protein
LPSSSSAGSETADGVRAAEEADAANAALRGARARVSRALRRAALPLYCSMPPPSAAQHAHWVLGSPAAVAAGFGGAAGGDAALRRAALADLRSDAEEAQRRGGRAA